MTQMKVLLSFVVFGILLASLSFAAVAENSIKVNETTVCAISANPAHFNGQVVIVASHYESDGMHGSILTDSNCKDYGIAVSIQGPFIGEAAFEKATHVGYPGTLDKTITGTFVGKFRWHPGKIPNRIIVLQEVRDLSNVMKH